MTQQMTPETKETGKERQDDELLVDTSKMNKAKAAALEIAESARQKEFTQRSFARQLFMGSFDWNMLMPFPRQTAEEKKIGDELCKKVGDYLKANLDPAEVDETRTVPESVVKGLGEMGLFGMKIPKEYGGMGLSQVNYNRVMQTVGSYCASTCVLLSAHQSIGVPEPLKMFGTEEQKKKYFPRYAKGEVSAFALTEPEVGSDPAQMSMTAELTEDKKHYILNGRKLWCTNGPIAGSLVVMAKTAPKVVRGKEVPQISALIVEGDAEGLEVVHRCDFMGIRGIQNGLLSFTNVKVPAENLLWEEGRGLALALRTLNTGRLTIPAASVGGAKYCLAVARRWGKAREQWGSSIAKHEAGAEKLAGIASTTFAMDAVTWLTSHWADAKQFDIRIEAAMAKLFCSEALWRVVDETLQLRGGRGYERGTSLEGRGEKNWPIERVMRDTRINLIIEGTSEVMRLILAREALDPHLQVAAPLLKKSTGIGEKIAGAFKALGFYAGWYPQQWVNMGLFRTHSEAGELAKWFQYIESTAHKLTRKVFHQMAKHGPALEKRQIILGELMSVATELFAMASTCAYALELQNEKGDQSSVALADHFCTMARVRIRNHFSRAASGEERVSNKLAARVLEGEMGWLEEGIMFED